MKIEDLLPTLNSTSKDDRDLAIAIAKENFSEEQLLELRKLLKPVNQDDITLGWSFIHRSPSYDCIAYWDGENQFDFDSDEEDGMYRFIRSTHISVL